MDAALQPFHPSVAQWFRDRIGAPSEPQRRGWPEIQQGAHTLIAAPTGTGKTLSAFLWAMDQLLRQGDELPDATQVLYVSPLRALGNDVQKNLSGPLAELRELDPSLPEVRVLVRTGDTPQSERTRMTRKPPHILVTTPESLYILLTSDGGRDMLRRVRTVILDEIHAIAGDKRGAHLALSLERLSALTGDVQRIGLSATQKPLSEVGRLLVGQGRECELVDVGHLRELDLEIEIPPSPLEAVCSAEVWGEVYDRVQGLIEEHRTTLVFVNTRKMAERVAAQLTDRLGADVVTCHHSSLSRTRRLDAEQRLKEGSLRALVATASLELGIDIGDIDLVIQVGTTRSIATLLQRVGRAGHGIGRIPKGRLFPLTIDELVEAGALLRATLGGELDRTPQPGKPLDILAQQIVAACVPEDWDEDELFEQLRRAWPFRELTREEFDEVVALHTGDRHALLHRDGVNGRLRATKRARLRAYTGGGAIPDNANYDVLVQPEGTRIGSIDEDFAVEASQGDIFQLGNSSWQVLRVEQGKMHVSDAGATPPTLPFWFGEAPSRSTELSSEIATLRDECDSIDLLGERSGMKPEAAQQLVDYFDEARKVLGQMPTQDRLVLERFFDESGGMQLVLHSPFGSRINRAFGYALRKRFCRRFSFELQAAANEEAIVFSLGPQQSFPLEEVFDYVRSHEAKDILVQAIVPTPLFKTRWRWNAVRSLLLERWGRGRKVPAPLLRMRAEDLLSQAFPDCVACPETMDAGDLTIPWDNAMVRQTFEDCLQEAMDLEGLEELLRRLESGDIERVALDTPEPSILCRSILNAAPYAFLDDAPLEERRTQAVLTRRTLDKKTADDLGALDDDAVARVKEQAWPQPENAEEVHEALQWMGYVTDTEATPWLAWLMELRGVGRVERLDDGRWLATETSRDPKDLLRGRLEALGPVFAEEVDAQIVAQLELEGCVLRTRWQGRDAWCNRRLLARIHRLTLERLRKEIEPVSPADFLRFLGHWQFADPATQVEGPRGVREVIARLSGFEAPAASWESSLLRGRVKGYRQSWLDELAMSGELVWGRWFGSGASPVRSTPIAFVLREDLDAWQSLAGSVDMTSLSGSAAAIFEVLENGGALFARELQQRARLLPSQWEDGIAELVARGVATCDAFGGLRQLLVPSSRRRRAVHSPGRWTLLRSAQQTEPDVEFYARQLLQRTGVVFKRTIQRERAEVPWRDLLRVYRSMELRGEVRGGRFVASFAGEQYALPEAVPLLRKIRKQQSTSEPVEVAAADPLNLRGILTPDERVPANVAQLVKVG